MTRATYLSILVMQTICLELSGSCCNNIYLFRTYVCFSSQALLMKIVFLEVKYKGNERARWTACGHDIH